MLNKQIVSRLEPFLSLNLPRIFARADRSEPAPLHEMPPVSWMNACAAYHKAHPQGDIPVFDKSLLLEDGGIVLRNLDGENLALVLREKIDLARTESPPVLELKATKTIARAMVISMTVWACPSCSATYQKKGQHLSTYHTCPKCQTSFFLHSDSAPVVDVPGFLRKQAD